MSGDEDDLDFDDFEPMSVGELILHFEAIMEGVRWAKYLSDPANWDQDL